MTVNGGSPQGIAPARHALFGGPAVDRVVHASDSSVLDASGSSVLDDPRLSVRAVTPLERSG